MFPDNQCLLSVLELRSIYVAVTQNSCFSQCQVHGRKSIQVALTKTRLTETLKPASVFVKVTKVTIEQ